MKAAKFAFLGRMTLMLTILVVIVAGTTGNAQTTVFVPGNASGCFGNPVDTCVPFVAALTVSGPGTITVTYVSGTVTDAGGINTGPGGAPWNASGQQSPIQEANGVSGGTINNLDALIGVFVPKYRVNDRRGFQAIDGTKNLTRVGIKPHLLRLIGEGRSFDVHEAGTLFLGINDWIVGDNGGGFTVTVTGP